MTDEQRKDWIKRFFALMQENPDAEITLLQDDELTLSYGPSATDEVELGSRRKVNLINLQAHVEELD